jgi:hypothetical protein
MEDDYNNLHFLIETSTTFDCITSGEILDSKNKQCGENSNSSLLNLLQSKYTGITTTHVRESCHQLQFNHQGHFLQQV